jgi:tRNA G18 (ribose-2'-O)-methylase SpoU
MHRIEQIVDLTDPAVHVYRTLRQPVEHFREGIFVAEGEKVVRRLLESPLTVLSLLVTPEWLEAIRPALDIRIIPSTVFVAPKGLLEEIVGFHLHQGIMALGQVPAPADIASLVALPPPFLFIALDGLTNAENIGVLVRNAAAFGTQGIIVGETSSSPYLRRAVRNSMGAVFSMPVVHTTDLIRTIGELQSRHGIRVIGAHPHADMAPLPDVDLTGPCCLVFGSEGEGLSERVREACDTTVAVPMQRNVDSLNVASAAAVFLYEVYRQRRQR